MDPDNRAARVAGLLYLVTITTGLFSLMFVPSRIHANGDAASLVGDLLASESLFRAGIAAGVLGYITFLMLPLALHRLLGPVDTVASFAMVALATVQVPIYFVAVAKQLDALSLLDSDRYGEIFSPGELSASVMQSMEGYSHLLMVSEVFMGLWLFPFGYLVWKSDFLPNVLGVLLMLGCFGYLADFFIPLLLPHASVSSVVMLPASLGEIGIALWLVIMGVGKAKRAAG